MKWPLKLKKNLDILGLGLILLFIFITNFKSGTYLIGWDNLIPELNLGMNIKRSFLAVWQEYQGLGLVGGMGHATDLIRQLITIPLTLFLPTHLIRYLWHFFCLAFGTFGIFFGLKNYLKFKPLISFSASAFYLLNFGTIQNFWVPFEPFSFFWALFPWLIFSLLNYLKKPNRQHLRKFLIFNILAIPSFYVPTVFIVYLITISIIIFSYYIFTKKIKLSPLWIILLINAFWLIPFFYFLKNDISNPQLAFGNQMASEETILRNQARGTIPDFLILRGYYYDLPVSGGNSIMEPWQQHLSSPIILTFAYLISLTIIIGLIKLLFFSKKKFSYFKLTILLFFLLSCLTLLSATPLFSQLNYLLRKIPLLDQVFRSPFTKFIVPAIFTFTILSAFGLDLLQKYFKKSKLLSKTIIPFYLLLLFIVSFPVFKGNLFYSKLRQKLPSDYSSLIEFFKSQPKTARIMNLPSGDFWGWTNYRFGTKGSGFIWYGIEQPILDRAFDVWNLNNEKYYQELNYAIQKQDLYLFQKILQKYSVSYLIFDNNVYFPNQKIYAKLANPTKEMIDKIPTVMKVKQFGQITVYKNLQRTSPYLSSEIENSNLIPQAINEPQLLLIDVDLINLEDNTPNNLTSRHYSNIIFDKAHLIEITHKNIKGYPLTFSAISENSNISFFTQKLDHNSDWKKEIFFIPQMTNSLGDGLTLLFNNSSFDKSTSINQVKNIKIYQTEETTPSIEPINQIPLKFSSNIFYYKIEIPNEYQSQFLNLPQSFHKGWIAFYFNNLKPVFLKNHTISNNWNNAWELPDNINSSQVHIIFWPQLLQFLGFAITTLIIIWVFKRPIKNRQ